MKKIIIASLLGLLLGISCKKINSIPSQLDLHNNPDFIEYVNGSFDLYSKMTLTSTNRNKMPFAKSEKDLLDIYGSSQYAKLKMWAEKSAVLIDRLNKEYGELDPEIVKEQALIVLYPEGGVQLTNAPNACRKEYYTCMSAVLATAILCHSACIASNVAAPFCIALCLTIEIHQGLECAALWCDNSATKVITKN